MPIGTDQQLIDMHWAKPHTREGLCQHQKSQRQASKAQQMPGCTPALAASYSRVTTSQSPAVPKLMWMFPRASPVLGSAVLAFTEAIRKKHLHLIV